MNTERTNEQRIQKLSEQAKERKETAIHEAKIKKMVQWLAIQDKTPETAEFLKMFSASFGKPSRLKIMVDNVVLIDL